MARAASKRAKRRKPQPYARVAKQIAAIEAEMKRIGLWRSEPYPGETGDAQGALWDAMTFARWLQFELVPHAQQIIAVRGEFPDRSALRTMAVRNFDGMPEAETLIHLLAELDRLVDR